jgi:hypothetical protein
MCSLIQTILQVILQKMAQNDIAILILSNENKCKYVQVTNIWLQIFVTFCKIGIWKLC